MFKHFILLFAVLATLASCNSNKFKVEGTELLARALCHEIDHLNGILFTDLADEMVEPEEVEEKRKK